MYKGSFVTRAANTPRKSFQLALAYALSVGRQEDVADACGVHQSTMSRWLRGRGPTNGRLLRCQQKLVGYVERCNRGLRRALPVLIFALLLAGCASPARVDAFLHDTDTAPGKEPYRALPRETTGKYTTTGGINVMPTRACTRSRADALAYARLWVKFKGRAPVPFGYDADTDAAVLALTEYHRATMAASK